MISTALAQRGMLPRRVGYVDLKVGLTELEESVLV
jgi:hypothetical protein